MSFESRLKWARQHLQLDRAMTGAAENVTPSCFAAQREGSRPPGFQNVGDEKTEDEKVATSQPYMMNKGLLPGPQVDTRSSAAASNPPAGESGLTAQTSPRGGVKVCPPDPDGETCKTESSAGL